ncbi:IclR family transcriptional regulator [Streptomyces nitrosporeus]|uniref:IclR family transcriptional regulator n=1 Tax=Streptomyces nitrosporeus TaxID=28894 RepID=A0A5J6F4V4_9ACTN|nr:IclR family transcriptional regulator [Streptomyces nitrosporeus]QEU71281.1 IclR family transcriptional regulator [Streptomyces nitrosporeus]GGY99148.1 IclR family transcriptional regulator [Streptomyces nitrosporeus]
MADHGGDTPQAGSPPQAPGVLQTVDRALVVLLTFTEQRPEWGVSELSRHHGWDKAVVQRLLTTLAARGFLLCDSTTRRYRPGPALSRLARVSEYSGVLPSLARPVLARMLRETGESVVLNVPHGAGYRCAAAVDGTGPVRYTAIIGAVMPGHAGASGHAIFAHHPEREIRQMFGPTGLARFNDRTITDLDALFTCYARVRADGHCVSYGEYDEAVTAVSAPVLQGGAVAASLTVIGPSHRVDRAVGTLVPLVRAGAAEVTAALGG